MPGEFLHGVETFQASEGPIPIYELKTAVNAVVGLSAQGEPGELLVIRTREEGRTTFGDDAEGMTIPKHLDAVFDFVGSATVIGVNVYDPAVHTNGYTDVLPSDIIAGLEILDQAFSKFGFAPKIIACPGWGHQTGVGAEMVSMADKLRATALIDAGAGLTPEAAVTFKGGFSSGRAVVCYPMIKIYDTVAEAEALDWLSSRLAGLMTWVDKTYGYWYSPSNFVLQGVTGLERDLSYVPNDTDCEVNYVNSQGLYTVLNYAGSGFRGFGNHTTAFPAATDPVASWIAWQRVSDIVDEAVEYFTLQFLDRPMFSGRIEDARRTLLIRIRESVQDFLDELVGRGALVYGKIRIRPEDNPAGQLAAGQLTYEREWVAPVPAERITYRSVANINRLAEVFNRIAAQFGGE